MIAFFTSPMFRASAIKQHRSTVQLLRRTNFCAPRTPSIVYPSTPSRPFASTPVISLASAAADDATAPPKPNRVPAIIRPVVPAPEMFPLGVEDRAQLRTDVIKSVTEYIRRENLQDPADKRQVRCDPLLKSVLGVDQCTLIQLSKYIRPHLRKPEELGGHYLQQAQQEETAYLERKAREGSEQRRSSKSDSGRRQRRSDSPILRPLILSDDLATICRAKELSRPAIIKAVWAYIRLNNLQAGAGQPVRCDFLLKKVYGADELTSKDIMKGISPHVTKKE